MQTKPKNEDIKNREKPSHNREREVPIVKRHYRKVGNKYVRIRRHRRKKTTEWERLLRW